MCAISSLTSTFAISSPDEFLFFTASIFLLFLSYLSPFKVRIILTISYMINPCINFEHLFRGTMALFRYCATETCSVGCSRSA